jgi:hypothetical protein
MAGRNSVAPSRLAGAFPSGDSAELLSKLIIRSPDGTVFARRTAHGDGTLPFRRQQLAHPVANSPSGTSKKQSPAAAVQQWVIGNAITKNANIAK